MESEYPFYSFLNFALWRVVVMSQTDDTQETEEHELGVTKPFPSSYETNDCDLPPIAAPHVKL